jgi:leucyl aminopeptidase
MELTLISSPAPAVDADAVVVLEPEGAKRADLATPLEAFYDSGEITGKFLDFALFHGVAGYKARRVVVAGSGKPEKFDAAALRKLAGAAVRFLKGKGTAIAFVLDEGCNSPAHVAAVAEGALLGAWEPDRLKTEKDKDDAKPIASVAIAVAGVSPELTAALERGRIIAEAANLTRDISVEPPNLLHPTAMAEHARRMSEAAGPSFDVLDRDRMRQLGMGALLGVAQGSAEPPLSSSCATSPPTPSPAFISASSGKA